MEGEVPVAVEEDEPVFEDSVVVLLEDVPLTSSAESLSEDVLRSTVSFFVPDEGGRALWSSQFRTEAEVGWDVFCRGVRAWGGAGLLPEQLELLAQFHAQLLGGHFERGELIPPPRVSMEVFGRISWLFPHASLPRLLADFEVLARLSWFHGACSLEDATEAIRGQPKGCFLIRVGQGIASGSLSLSRVTDPMTVLHSRLYWNVQHQQWALKTAMKGSKSASGPTSPRVTLGTAQSMVAAVEKRRQLHHRAEQQGGAEEERKIVSTLRSYLQGLREYDNVLGVSPLSPRPLQEWVAKHSKALDLRVACPGSPFAFVLANRHSNISKK
jgi:hypothetical protein